MAELPLVAIIGRPNVGKSALFNRLVGRRRAIVTDEPGVTRDRIYGVVRGTPRSFRVVDMGGIGAGNDLPLSREVARQAEMALAEANGVIFVVDARAGTTALDVEIATMLRRRALPVVLAANKIDVDSAEPLVAEFYRLGLGPPVGVSAEHDRGIPDLLDAVDEMLGPRADVDYREEHAAEAPLRVAIVGRPNAGKSSLANRLLGEERVLVDEAPGTTRDSVDVSVEHRGKHFVLVDTAGLRRRGRVRLVAESLSVAHARRSMRSCDVVVLVLDAVAGFGAQDAHVAGYARESLKPIVVAVNKWDLVRDRAEAAKRWEGDIRSRLRFVKETPLVFVSAKSGQRVTTILDAARAVHEAAGRRVPTPELNRWLREVAAAERSAPARGGSIRLFYATQTGVHPPRFVLFCNDARHVHFSLRRHLDNSLRSRFGFGAAPLLLRFRSRRERIDG